MKFSSILLIFGIAIPTTTAATSILWGKLGESEFPHISEEESKKQEEVFKEFLKAPIFEGTPKGEGCRNKIKEFTKDALFEGFTGDKKGFSFRKKQTEKPGVTNTNFTKCPGVSLDYKYKGFSKTENHVKTSEYDVKYTIWKEQKSLSSF